MPANYCYSCITVTKNSILFCFRQQALPIVTQWPSGTMVAVCVCVRQSVFDPVSSILPTDWWVQLWQRSVLFLVGSHKEKLPWTMFLSRTWNWAPQFCLIQRGFVLAKGCGNSLSLWWEPRLCPRLHPPLLKAGLGDVLLLLLLLRWDPGGKQINSICYYNLN